jgi:outer membrane protein assembly factor BamE (lipoprotein component of BamABCDE complex)
MKKQALLPLLLVSSVGLASCATVAQHQENLSSNQERKITLGIVQKYIHKGVSQANVAEALGSPNIVTKDSEGNETWIYDKVAQETSYSASGGSIGIGGGGAGSVGSGGLGGVVGGSYGSKSGAYSSTQRTLTVIIKFDSNGLVKSVAYNASQF